MVNLQRMELSKCRNPFFPLLLSEITVKCHKNSEWSMVEGQVFLTLTGFMRACPGAELVIGAFPPAMFLPWQKGISPLGPRPSAEVVCPIAMAVSFPISCLTDWRAAALKCHGLQKKDSRSLYPHTWSTAMCHSPDVKGKLPTGSGQANKLEGFHQVPWAFLRKATVKPS